MNKEWEIYLGNPDNHYDHNVGVKHIGCKRNPRSITPVMTVSLLECWDCHEAIPAKLVERVVFLRRLEEL